MIIKHMFRPCRLSLLCGLLPLYSTWAAEPAAAPTKPRTIVIKDERASEKDYKLLPLGVMDYDTINKTCRPWLSPGGLLVYEEYRASVLVYDTPAVIKKISEYLRDADRHAPNIRVEFEYTDASQDNVSFVTVKPTTSAEVKKWSNPQVQAGIGKGNDRRFTGQFIVTRSNLPASIWVGDTVIDPAWLDFIRRHPARTVIMQDGHPVFDRKYDGNPKMTPISASLYIKPVWENEDTINIELYPEIRFTDAGGIRKSIKVAQLATRIRVKEGQKLLIGSMFDGGKETFASIFGPDFLQRSDMRRIAAMTMSAKRAGDNYRHFTALATETVKQTAVPVPAPASAKPAP